ncbi:MAG: NUDIX hydrolase [Parvibaculum sp.]
MNAETPTTKTTPVRPRDAASLVLIDNEGSEPRILMGKRHAKMKFIPDAFVFPGGKLDPHDHEAEAATPLSQDESLAQTGASHAKTKALAMAAVRETFEETGYLLAAQGDIGKATGETWNEFRTMGLAPALHHVTFMARAITPPQSPIRFHARFFQAPRTALSGTLKGSGELSDLDWYPLTEALKLPIIDVTEFILTEIQNSEKGNPRLSPPLYCYLNNKPRVLEPKPR